MGYFKDLYTRGYGKRGSAGKVGLGRSGSGAGLGIGGLNSDLYIDEQDLYNTLAKMGNMLDELNRKSTQRRISNMAAVPVQMKSREVAKSTFGKTERAEQYKIHYYYNDGGKKISTIHAGHTESAIQVMTRKRNKLRRARTAVVGPLKTGKITSGGVFGLSKAENPSKVDAYYAAAILGRARAFGQRIMQRGLLLAANSAFQIMDREVTKEVRKQWR